MNENEYLETASVERTSELSHQNEIGPIKSTRIFLKDIEQCLENIYDFGREEYYDVLVDLIDKFVHTRIINADADDFHNIAVQLSRRDEDEFAIKIIEVGLNNFPWNSDLLADYIQFGTSICVSRDEKGRADYERIQNGVKECYDKITQIPQTRWTWRAYSFSIDYLADFLADREAPDQADVHLEQAYKLAQSFVDQYSSDESYMSLSKVVEKKDGQKKSLKILENALNNSELKIAPKCAMRYAEKMFTNGDFETSLKYAQRGIRDAAQTQQKVSLGYLYLLSALSKISLMKDATEIQTSKQGNLSRKQQVLDIFCDFNIAVREFGKNEEYSGIIVSQANALIDKTSIKVPEEKYWDLYNLLQSNR